MIRPVARRRGGPVLITVGFLGVGGSVALLGGAGPWLLGAHVTAGLTVVLVVASVFGVGLATPIEQVVSRRLNSGGAGGSREPLLVLVSAGVVTATIACIVGSGSSEEHVFTALLPGIVMAVGGYVAVVSVRSRIAGAGDLWAYAGILVVESVVRLALIVAAIVDREHDVALLASAVGVPLLVAAAAGLLLDVGATGTQAGPPAAMTVRARIGEQGAFVAVAFCYQICLNALTLVLWLGSAATQTVSAVGAANSYFLAPTVLIGGVTTHALIELSRAWGQQDKRSFVATERSSMRKGLVTAVVATGLAAVAEPVALPFYYHHDLGLPGLLLVAMAMSTVITVLAVVAIQPLLSAGHGRPAALSWLSGAGVTLVALALSTGTNWLADVALVIGPAVALAGAWWSARRMIAHWPGPPSSDALRAAPSRGAR